MLRSPRGASSSPTAATSPASGAPPPCPRGAGAAPSAPSSPTARGSRRRAATATSRSTPPTTAARSSSGSGSSRSPRRRRSCSALRQALEQARDLERLDGLDERGADRALVGPARREHPLAGSRGGGGRAARVGPARLDPQPARGPVALVGQPDAAGVEEADLTDDPVVVLVGVAGDDEAGRGAGQRLGHRSGGESRVRISSS